MPRDQGTLIVTQAWRVDEFVQTTFDYSERDAAPNIIELHETDG